MSAADVAYPIREVMATLDAYSGWLSADKNRMRCAVIDPTLYLSAGAPGLRRNAKPTRGWVGAARWTTRFLMMAATLPPSSRSEHPSREGNTTVSGGAFHSYKSFPYWLAEFEEAEYDFSRTPMSATISVTATCCDSTAVITDESAYPFTLQRPWEAPPPVRSALAGNQRFVANRPALHKTVTTDHTSGTRS